MPPPTSSGGPLREPAKQRGRLTPSTDHQPHRITIPKIIDGSYQRQKGFRKKEVSLTITGPLRDDWLEKVIRGKQQIGWIG